MGITPPGFRPHGGGNLHAQEVLSMLTADELKEKAASAETSLRIVIQGVHPSVWQNGYFYNDGSANGTHAYDAADCIWLLEKTTDTDENLYYIRHEATTGDDNYIQQNNAKTLGAAATATKFRIVFPKTSANGGAGETLWGKSAIWSEAPEDHLVRFVATNNNAANWFRFAGGTDVTYVTGNGDFTVMLVYEPLSAATVTYNIYNDEGTLLGTETKEMAVGNPVAYSVPSYVTVTSATYDENTTVPADGGTYEVHTKATLPFTVSPDAGENATWTGLSITRPQGTLWLFGNEDNLVHTERIAPTAEAIANYQWCFTGDWFNGFVLTNKGTGKHMAALGEKNPNNNNYVAISLSDTEKTLLEYVANEGGTHSFRIKGTASNYLSNQGGYTNTILSIWSTTDAGSQINLVSDMEAAIIAPFKNDLLYSCNSVGGYTEADLAGLEEVNTIDAWNAFQTALGGKTPIAFDATKYYRIKNYNRDLSYQDYNAQRPGQGAFMGTYDVAQNSQPINAHGTSMAEAASVWQLIGNDTDGYKVYNLNSKKYLGKTAANASQYLTETADEAEAGIYQFEASEGVTGQFHIVCTNGTNSNANQLHTSTYGVMNYNSNSANSSSSWYLLPAEALEVNLNAASDGYWSSLYLPFAVEVPGDAEFYVASSQETGCVNLERVQGILPAEQGVVVKAATEALALNISHESASWTTTNLFEGTLESVAITEEGRDGYYTLGAADGAIGLYHPSATSLKANRAYLATTQEANALRLVFGNETTGIEGVEAGQQATVYHDLCGRRVSKPGHGIYIVNKKKVLIP